MPFTPKFVDLVRNVTSVQGTGPVTLGAAVSGYASLADAVSAGEQFYYSIQGIDKPAEREVGRGTMQANGTVSREAMSGGLTNFTPGAKTIALVAAAEWFGRIEQAAGTGSATVAGAAGLAAIASPVAGQACAATDAGFAGLFRFDPSDLSAKVAADKRRGIYVAPASDLTGASGAWVRQVGEAISPLWFGVVEGNGAGANGAGNSAAIEAMFDTLRSRAVNPELYYQGLEPVRFPPGYFEFATTIDISDGTLTFEGASTGFAGGDGTVLKFPAGQTGIRVQSYNTSGGEGGAGVVHRGAGGTIIRGFVLRGGFTATEGEHHGIHLKNRALVENMRIQMFEGDGIYCSATGGSATNEGNANNTRINNIRIEECRDGIFVNGGDANVWTVIGVDVSSNRRWGIWDSSFLGNTYIGCHSATNGNTAQANAIAPSVVSHSGSRYGVIVGQEAGASTNAPSGTAADNAWWYYISAGAVHAIFPLWVGGTTYRAGGAYCTDSDNAANLFSGCYTEQGSGKAQLVSPTLVVGGMMTRYLRGTAGTIEAGGGTVRTRSAFQAEFVGPESTTDVRVGESAAAQGTIIYAKDSVAAASAWRWKFSGGDIRVDYGNSNSQVGYLLTGPTTAEQFGTGAAVPFAFHAPQLMVGSTRASARLMTGGGAAPTSGAHAVGEVVFNDGSVTPIEGVSYWRCTAAGTPGVWAAARLAATSVTVQAGAAYTAAIGDANSYVRFTSAAAVAFTIPPNSAVPFPIGTVIEIEQAGAGAVSLAAGSGVTINARGDDLTLAGPYAVAAVKKVAADTWTLAGDL